MLLVIYILLLFVLLVLLLASKSTRFRFIGVDNHTCSIHNILQTQIGMRHWFSPPTIFTFSIHKHSPTQNGLCYGTLLFFFSDDSGLIVLLLCTTDILIVHLNMCMPINKNSHHL